MIYKIAKLLRDEISTLDFVEIAAGLAKPRIIRNPQEEGVADRVIPVAYNDLGLECEEGTMYQLTPNTKKKSIVWWEDNGLEVIEEGTYYYECQASLKCVCWWNLPLINTAYTDPSLLVANLVAAVPAQLPNIDYLVKIRVAFEGQDSSGAEAVSKYNLDEAETQFSTFPYFVSALNFSVDFAFAKNCVDEVEIDASSCPPQMS